MRTGTRTGAAGPPSGLVAARVMGSIEEGRWLSDGRRFAYQCLCEYPRRPPALGASSRSDRPCDKGRLFPQHFVLRRVRSSRPRYYYVVSSE